jgi:hypothetical protein
MFFLARLFPLLVYEDVINLLVHLVTGYVSQKEKENLGDQGIDGRMGLELILGRLAGGV